jgi:hypothetical protein
MTDDLIVSLRNYENDRRHRLRMEAQEQAARCDCWKLNGPICAKCKLEQFTREISRCDD